MRTAWGDFELRRFPLRKNDLLRAWDAADEYLLDVVKNDIQLQSDARVLICNDGFGALAVGLHEYTGQSWTDSYLTEQATSFNLQKNRLEEDSLQIVNSMELPSGPVDLVLFKVPKNLGLLEYQLLRLRPLLNGSSRVLLAGMMKNLPSSVWPMLEKFIGPTTTSLARKKAKVIQVQLDPELKPPKNRFPVVYQLENTNYRIINHANIFSRDSLDIGTRFFLEHLPEDTGAQDIVDLGCGNGVVGLMAAEKNPLAKLWFVDESYMAVASAKENFELAFGGSRQAEYVVGDRLNGFPGQSADLVLCNPPFHQQQVVGDQIAMSMFKQSRRVLKSGGELWVIGNRHLAYHKKLGRWFKKVDLLASNNKFVILKAYNH